MELHKDPLASKVNSVVFGVKTYFDEGKTIATFMVVQILEKNPTYV